MQITETETVTTETQQMVIISLPGLLVMGFALAILLIFFGRQKGRDNPSYYTLIGAGIILLGIMVVVVPPFWYGYWALMSNSIEMLFTDILILTLLSTVGGIIIGYGLVFIQKRPEVPSLLE